MFNMIYNNLIITLFLVFRLFWFGWLETGFACVFAASAARQCYKEIQWKPWFIAALLDVFLHEWTWNKHAIELKSMNNKMITVSKPFPVCNNSKYSSHFWIFTFKENIMMSFLWFFEVYNIINNIEMSAVIRS